MEFITRDTIAIAATISVLVYCSVIWVAKFLMWCKKRGGTNERKPTRRQGTN